MKAVSLLLLLISAATAMRVPRRIAASGLAAAGVACLARRPAHAMASFQAMADALGYFPVQDDQAPDGFRYTPAAPLRSSTAQAMELARHLSRRGAVFYGAYWCPHCRNQRELFGKEAIALLRTVECDPRGYGSDRRKCEAAGVSGYPTWQIGRTSVSGERTLADLAQLSGFKGFDPSLEPVLQAAGSCQ
mmetsp:Transcript_3158/g.6801  ORF Transcript_3158/g.6801 Transcript_3158/m.6801 type:complete len:190 (-) Transcript_3158:246-815(-)